MKLRCINLLWSPWILYFHRWAGQLAYHQTQKRSSKDPQDRAAMGEEGLQGLWFLASMTQQHPGGSQAQNNEPLCARNIDTTCPIFLPPCSLWSSPRVSLVHGFVLSPTSWQRGMLIKEPEAHKIRAYRDMGGAITSKQWCVPLWSGDVELRFVTKWPGID